MSKIVKLPPEDPQAVRDRDLKNMLPDGPRKRPGNYKLLENNHLDPEQLSSWSYARS